MNGAMAEYTESKSAAIFFVLMMALIIIIIFLQEKYCPSIIGRAWGGR